MVMSAESFTYPKSGADLRGAPQQAPSLFLQRQDAWLCVGAQALLVLLFFQGDLKRLPKFKFSAKFPIGLHVILQIQIKKIENDCYLMWKIILTENPSRCNLAPLLK